MSSPSKTSLGAFGDSSKQSHIGNTKMRKFFQMTCIIHHRQKWLKPATLQKKVSLIDNVIKVRNTVGSLVWVKFLRGLTHRDINFRRRIILRMILTCFLVISIWIPGCFRKGFRPNPGLWVQKKSSSLDKAPKMLLCPTELLGQFPCHSTS